LPEYRYEHIFIDNCSEDATVTILKEIAKRDKNVKILVNTRNFGPVRSPVYAYLQATGDAIISIVADLQDPPELIKVFIKEWELGAKIVAGIKEKTNETFLMKKIRKFYYWIVTKIANTQLIKDFTGFGLYDRCVLDAVRDMNDAYPYWRGAICEIGYPVKTIPFIQPARKRGISQHNFYMLFDIAMLGLTNHSKIPIRFATIVGSFLGMLSFLAACSVLVLKLIFWDRFSMGYAPIMISIFFFFSITLFFLGIIGEYVASIHTQVIRRPLVYVKEKINFYDT